MDRLGWHREKERERERYRERENGGYLSCVVMIRVHPLNAPPGIQFNSH